VCSSDLTSASVRRQFRRVVSPMHRLYVAPQTRWADLVLTHPVRETDVYRVAVRLTELLPPAGPWLGSGEACETEGIKNSIFPDSRLQPLVMGAFGGTKKVAPGSTWTRAGGETNSCRL